MRIPHLHKTDTKRSNFRPSQIPWPNRATKLHHGELTNRMIACALSVHKNVGLGFYPIDRGSLEERRRGK